MSRATRTSGSRSHASMPVRQRTSSGCTTATAEHLHARTPAACGATGTSVCGTSARILRGEPDRSRTRRLTPTTAIRTTWTPRTSSPERSARGCTSLVSPRTPTTSGLTATPWTNSPSTAPTSRWKRGLSEPEHRPATGSSSGGRSEIPGRTASSSTQTMATRTYLVPTWRWDRPTRYR